MEKQAQGFVEAAGYVAAIEVADAMAKAADVVIVMAHKVDGPRVCVICEGDVAACQAAVSAGSSLCESKGMLLGANVIARPEQGSAQLYTLLNEMKARKAAKKAERQAKPGGGKQVFTSDAGGQAHAVKTASAKKQTAAKSKTKK